MSQPALSSQIKALEKELGFAIFTRNRKRAVDITEGGAIFLMHAQKIAADMNRMYLNLGMYRPGASGEIRIGLFLTFGYTRVADIIKQFRAAYPDIKLIFRIDTSIGLVERVRAGELDVAMAVDCDPSILPDDEQVVIATNQGEAIAGSGSKAGEAFTNISHRILGESVPYLDLDSKKGFFRRVFGR